MARWGVSKLHSYTNLICDVFFFKDAFCKHSLIKGLWWVPFRFLCIASPDLSVGRKSLEVAQLVQDVGDKLSLCIRPMVMYRIFNSTHIRLCPVIIFCLHQGAIVYISFKLPKHSSCNFSVSIYLNNVIIVNSFKEGIQSINPHFISTFITNAFCPINSPRKSISAVSSQATILRQHLLLYCFKR